MRTHTCTKNLLSILPMVSDFCWWCTMSHSASQYTSCTTRSIKNPHLPPQRSRKKKVMNIALPISGTGLAGSWCSKLHPSAFILNPRTLEVSTTAADSFPLFILPLHQRLMASENTQHKELINSNCS